jgi:hypothetical protein
VSDGHDHPHGGDAGGIDALLDLIEEHPKSCRYDLLAHGYRLEWIGTDRLPYGDAIAILEMQPPDRSALWRELHPDLYDRTAEVVRLEAVAVLVAQLRAVWRGEQQVPHTFEELLLREPAKVVLSEDEVLAAMRAFDRAIGRG